MKEIAFTGTKKPYGWMGNMSRYSVTYDGKVWGSTEHLFQALRFDKDTPFREMIRKEDNPFEAKQIAKKYREHMSIVPCSPRDYANMLKCLRLKLETHPALVDELLETGYELIYEDVTPRGRGNSNLIWGALRHPDGTWEGENIMGCLWMKLRTEYMSKAKKVGKALEEFEKFVEGDKIKTLNDKIKRCMDEEMLTFTLNDDGELIAIGHFNGGADTIGHDENSLLSWEDFIKHS